MIILVLKKMMRMVANVDEDDNDELDTDDHADELYVTFEESLLALVDDTQKLHINH